MTELINREQQGNDMNESTTKNARPDRFAETDRLDCKSRVVQLPVAKVHRDPNQARRERNCAKYRQLVESIRKYGLIQPIVVSDHPTITDEYLCVVGHGRLEAHCELGRTEISALAVPGSLDRRTAIQLQLTENCVREAMSPFDVVDALNEWRIDGATLAEAAAAVGIDKATASRHQTTVDQLLPEFRELVESRKIGSYVAYVGARLPEEIQREFFPRVIQEGLGKIQAELLAKRLGKPDKRSRGQMFKGLSPRGCRISYAAKAGMGREDIVRDVLRP